MGYSLPAGIACFLAGGATSCVAVAIAQRFSRAPMPRRRALIALSLASGLASSVLWAFGLVFVLQGGPSFVPLGMAVWVLGMTWFAAWRFARTAAWQDRKLAGEAARDPGGDPMFSDFADSEAVERVLATAPESWRTGLITWQYGLLRAEAKGQPRPTADELARLMMRVIGSRTGFAVADTAMYGLIALAFLLAPALISPQTGVARGGNSLYLAALFALVLLALVVLRHWGRRGRAMRLVWRAKDMEPEDRAAMLRAALSLEVGDVPRARVSGPSGRGAGPTSAST